MQPIVNNDHQSILDGNEHMLILGGPGSGKTTLALKKAMRYIEDRKLKPGQKVLFLSFSRAAISRIQESSTSVIDKASKDSLSIQTFHSFFWEVLKTHSYLIGSTRHLKILSPHDVKVLLNGRNEDDPTWLIEKEQNFIDKGIITFDMFSSKMLFILKNSKVIKKQLCWRFPLIIVDEAQDTDSEQWDCVKSFANSCQIIMLGDLDQQIHDYRPDINAERIQDIITYLNPSIINLGTLNHRSSDTEIVLFGRDLLTNNMRTTGYNGVSLMKYVPKSKTRDVAIRQSVGILYKKIKEKTGKNPTNIAILSTWNNGVRIISNALRKDGVRSEIPHRVHFDETLTYLSSRIIAFLLEPKDFKNIQNIVIEFIKLMIDIEKSKGCNKEILKYETWISKVQEDSTPKTNKFIPEVINIITSINKNGFLGNPQKDWLNIREMLSASANKSLKTIGKNSEYLMAFNRGKSISAALIKKWQDEYSYTDARKILDLSIAASQMGEEDKNNNGINVLTVHKSKGKEFDGVIIFQDPFTSPSIAIEDKPPYPRSRRLLFVATTRAKHHMLILKNAYDKCPVIDKFKL